MNLRSTGLLLAILWLAGCATTSGPTPEVPVQGQEQAGEQTSKPEQVCIEKPARENEHELTAERMLTVLESLADITSNETKQRIKALQGRHDDLTAGDRFELLLLLSQKSADGKSLNQALKLLDKLEAETVEPSVKEVLDLQRQRLNFEQRYRTERRKSVELRKKIEYLKGLERDLEESNQRVEESLSPETEPAQ